MLSGYLRGEYLGIEMVQIVQSILVHGFFGGHNLPATFV